jgi:5-hydroxyisourate hydrolase-like protein (transthyretin family)
MMKSALAIFMLLTMQLPAQDGSIQGVIAREGTLEPIPGADIFLVPQNADRSQAPLRALSDDEGRFTINKLAPGKYTLLAQHDGFFAAGGTSKADDPFVPVSIAAGQVTSVSLKLAAGAVISGHILDANGQPAPRVTVEALQANEGVRSPFPRASRLTNDRGEYRLFWLAPGDYIISVSPRQPIATPASTNSGSQEQQVRTYYPGVSDLKMATPIRVKSGEEVTGMDIALRREVPVRTQQAPPTPRVKISGAVVNATAIRAPVTAVLFLASRPDAGSQPRRLTNVALNTASREFEVSGLSPGSYDLYARIFDPKTERESWGRTAIEITDQDLDGIRIEITEQTPGPTSAGSSEEEVSRTTR